MLTPNTTLPENLKGLVSHLPIGQAMPLGTMSDIPFLALKIASDDEALIKDNAIVCELKPSIFNIDHKDETIAACFVQLRLNGSDDAIYTAIYDLGNEKQYSDCHALLNMRKYGLFLATDTVHDFQAFDTPFDAPFDPRDVIASAREKRTDYTPDTFHAIVHALYSQHESPAKRWEEFRTIASDQTGWYAKMRIDTA